MYTSTGEARGTKPKTLWDGKEFNYQNGTTELKTLFDGQEVFDFPKPVALLERIIDLADDKDALVLDFFAGSGTTAHAVMARNLSDGGTRRCISIQLPEIVRPESGAARAGFTHISDVTRERIRRAGVALRQKHGYKGQIDVGFRFFKVDSSNMKEVYYTPDDSQQGNLLAQVDNIKPDRIPEDLLFQVLVDWGVDLDLPIAQETISGKTVFFVDTNALAACFESGVDEELVKEIAKRKPLRAVFRDSSFASDAAKINVEQIFKLLSPATEVRSI